MDSALKAEVQEIIELVKTVPEPLQIRTLELLLQDALDRAALARKRTRTESMEEGEEEPESDKAKGAKEEKTERRKSEGMNPDTLPMRVKAFMKRTKVTAKQLESLFHIEDQQYEPIWTLKATKFAKAQVRIALLQALHRALTSGEFSFDREEVREECRKKKSLDNSNFNVNFKNNGKLFSGLDKDGLVSLTDEGMSDLAKLITELAGASDGE